MHLLDDEDTYGTRDPNGLTGLLLEPVAYAKVSTPAERQEARLARRLKEIAAQEHAALSRRLAQIEARASGRSTSSPPKR